MLDNGGGRETGLSNSGITAVKPRLQSRQDMETD